MTAAVLERGEPETPADRHAHVIEHFNQTHAHYRRLWRLDHNLGSFTDRSESVDGLQHSRSSRMIFP